MAEHAPALNSPRSLEACRRQGIDPPELAFVPLKQFRKNLGVEAAALSGQILQLRFDHHEEKRQEKLRVLVEERQRIIEEEARGTWAPLQLSKHSSTSGGRPSLA